VVASRDAISTNHASTRIGTSIGAACGPRRDAPAHDTNAGANRRTVEHRRCFRSSHIREAHVYCGACSRAHSRPSTLLFPALETSTWHCLLRSCGFLVGAVPFGVLDLISMFGVQSASTGGTPTIINGVSTLAGWIEYAYAVSFTGLFGLAGGVTFWVVMRVFGQLAGEPNGTDAQPSKVRRGSWSIVSVAVVLTCAVFLLPSVVRDGSCHNLFRDGRTSIGPQIGADISLPAEDWPTLTQIFVDFGRTHSLSFRRDEQIRRGTLMWRDLNLCSEAGVNIDAVEQPGLAQMKSRIADRGIDITVYELKPGSDWKPLARDLINRIDTTWPQKITFRDPDGRVISVEEALKGRQ
jgi:hypothetical protein